MRVLDPLRCYMRIAAGVFEIHYKGRALRGLDAVIPRIGASITFYGTAVLRQFEMMGIRTPNSADAILRARDKLHALQLLARDGIGLPTTVFGDNPDDTADLLKMLGDPPHVIKLNEGAQGQGVLLAEKRSAAQGMIEAFRGLYANFLVQEFIREAKGADLRCFVVGGNVVAAMQRQAPEGDFRANLHRGGTATAVDPDRAGIGDGDPRGARHGPGRRRRRSVALASRAARAGGQFLAGPRRHRGRDRRRCRRRDHRAHRRRHAPARDRRQAQDEARAASRLVGAASSSAPSSR